MATLRITSELDNLATVRRFVEETAASFTDDAEAIGDVVLAVDEAVTNVILHGYRHGSGTIEIDVKEHQGALVVRVWDQASAFDPTHLPAPDVTVPLSQRAPGGLGVYLMHRLTDELRYRTTPEGKNELTLVKRVGTQGGEHEHHD
ncbi:MAG TPA: ATP-binding protein [Anaerolineae bacterium]